MGLWCFRNRHRMAWMTTAIDLDWKLCCAIPNYASEGSQIGTYVHDSAIITGNVYHYSECNCSRSLRFWQTKRFVFEFDWNFNGKAAAAQAIRVRPNNGFSSKHFSLFSVVVRFQKVFPTFFLNLCQSGIFQFSTLCLAFSFFFGRLLEIERSLSEAKKNWLNVIVRCRVVETRVQVQKVVYPLGAQNLIKPLCLWFRPPDCLM